MRAFLPLICLALAGCATNGVTVHEKTAEGYEFSMTQKTTSTIFASTEEGSGAVEYEGSSPDGSKFNLRAGAAVVGQKGGDPTALVLGVLQAIMPVIAQRSEQNDLEETRTLSPYLSDYNIQKTERLQLKENFVED